MLISDVDDDDNTNVTHSETGVHISYQLCCRTNRKARTWKTKQVMIWVRTEHSKGPEIRLEGGRRHTSSFHAGFRLTKHKNKLKSMATFTCTPIVWLLPIIGIESQYAGYMSSNFITVRPQSHNNWIMRVHVNMCKGVMVLGYVVCCYTGFISFKPKTQTLIYSSFWWYSLVKAMMRMMAISMKRNWKSPKLLRICDSNRDEGKSSVVTVTRWQ